MKLINYAVVTMMAFMPQAVWAIKPANVGDMPATSSTPVTVERSGTITAVNHQNRTATIDGVAYTYTGGIEPGLQPKMQVIFSTVKSGYSGPDIITAIQPVVPRSK